MFDPQDSAVIADPYPHYARLRREAPLLWLPSYDMWVVSRYSDVVAILRDNETFSSRLGVSADFGRPGQGQTGVHFRVGAPGIRVLIALDPPDHTVFRRAVSGAFSSRGIARLVQRVNALAQERVQCLLDRANAGDADFYRDVAEPLPVLVLAELLGLPAELREDVRQWARVLTADLGNAEEGVSGLGRGLEMLRYFRKEVARRRGRPEESLLSVLADSRAHGITDHEIIAFCTFLVVAGVETTTNQLTNLMDVFVRQPDVQKRLRAHPGLIPSVVDEGLRYDPPVQAFWRSATRDAVVAGESVPVGARIFVLFASANRDEDHFPDADTFVVDRQPNDHVGFGHGAHYCLGARLARLEIETVLRELCHATAMIEGRGDSVRTRSVTLRGFTRQGVSVVSTSHAKAS
jgi:cytochrome P450